MDLVRDWRKQAARAAGATALAPVVLLVAAVLLAAGGGLGGLGSLGQITAGPSVPPAELAAGETNALVSASPPPSPKVASGAGEAPRSAPRAGDRRGGAAPAQRRELPDGVAVRDRPAAPIRRTPSVRPTRPTVGKPQPSTPPPASPSPVPQTPITQQVPVPSPGPQIVLDTKNLGPALPPSLQLPPVQIIGNLPLPLPLLPPR